MISVRDATSNDLAAIVAIYNQSIPAGRATADTQPVTVESRRAWFGRFDPQKRPIWVAEEEDRTIGCVYLSSFYEGRPAYDQTAEISLYLDSDYQRRGLGSLLMQRMIDACPRLGVTTLIGMHFDHNKATHRLNQKFGFELAGHLTEIAQVQGHKRGLMISLLRIPPTSDAS
jgi:L-amino acid N-acyltransferase YncA